MKALNVNLETVPDKISNSNIVNKLCAVIQLTDKKYEWFISYLKGLYGEDYCIDHLYRSYDNSKVLIYPFEEDIQYYDKDQMVNWSIKDTLDISDSRNTTYLRA